MDVYPLTLETTMSDAAEPAPPAARKGIPEELKKLNKIDAMLSAMTPEEQDRAMGWLNAKYGQLAPARLLARADGAFAHANGKG